MKPAESVIICEGFHDRAFLRGWLEHLGCENFKDKAYRAEKPLKGKGQFAFKTPRGGWVRILPAGGDSKIDVAAGEIAEKSKSDTIANIVLVYDEDDPGGSNRGARFADWAKKQGAQPVPGTDDFELIGRMVATRLSLIIWSIPNPPSVLLPRQQTLERLVCAAISDVYPKRAENVAAWIDSRDAPPIKEKLHKTHAAFHMAGWFSERGYEGLFDALWEDAVVSKALLARLDAMGATRVIRGILDA